MHSDTKTTKPARTHRGAPGTEGLSRARRARGVVGFGHWWWALPGVLVVLAIHYVATGVGGFFAFTDWTGIGSFQLVGLENFQKILADPTKVLALGNTLLLAFGSVILVNIVGLAIALALNRTLKTRYVLRVLFFMPVVLSPLAVSYIWKFIFDYNGPINAILKSVGLESWQKTWLGDPSFAIWAVLIVIVWQQTGFAMVIYLAGLAGVPVEVEEAAAIDGTTLWQRFRHVTLPAIRPAVAISTTLGIVNGLRVFDQIMALTNGGPAGATETLATQVYKQAFSLANFGYGAALALILSAIILVFAVIQQRVTRGTES
jgi:raffinose/stachyose/melibiose transport system permease protein